MYSYVFGSKICWVAPPTPLPSNSHHQDFAFFLKSLETFIRHYYWVGVQSNIYIYIYVGVSQNYLPHKEKRIGHDSLAQPEYTLLWHFPCGA